MWPFINRSIENLSKAAALEWFSMLLLINGHKTAFERFSILLLRNGHNTAFERFSILLLINGHKPQPLRGSLYFC
jgi:hypothetical protein